jgi:cytochrome c55X
MLRWMLVSVLSLLGLGGAIAAPLSATRQEELHDLLIQDCGSCHGLTMRGGLGPALLPQNLRGRPREALIDTVMYGRPNTAMPPWNTMLKRDEAAWMIDQLRQGVTSP